MVSWYIVFFYKYLKISKIADWSKSGGGLASDTDEISFLEDTDDESETLLVVTTVERPYVMIKEGAEGNEAFEGFAIDLLKA